MQVFHNKAVRRGSSLVMALMLTGCSMIAPRPPEDVAERLSSSYPVRTLTGFTEGLACMDRMFIARKVEPVYVTAAPIPDYSENRGGAGYAARDMLISAVAEMTKESAAIRYVAFDRQTPDIVALQNSHPKKASLRVPDFFIRGAVTQINTAPYSKQIGDSLNVGKIGNQFQGGSFGNSASVSLSSVSLDMAVGLVNNYQMLPGVFSANTFSVEKRSNSDELSISLTKVGAVFSVNENKAEALSMALRGLIEVGLIELFGKLYGVPYWECLAEIGENAPDKDEARARYAAMSPAERAEYVAAQLVRQKLMRAETVAIRDGQYTPAFHRALMQYRMRYDLLGSGEVDFPVFARLWKDERRPAPESKVAKGAADSQGAPAAPRPQAAPPSPAGAATGAPAASSPAPSAATGAPSSGAAVESKPAAASAPPPAAPGAFIVTSPNTLRLISRQIFPKDPAARVRFVDEMAKANPTVFANPQKAADQPIPSGTHLHVPPQYAAATATAAKNGAAAPLKIRPRKEPAPAAMKPAPAPDRPLLPAPTFK